MDDVFAVVRARTLKLFLDSLRLGVINFSHEVEQIPLLMLLSQDYIMAICLVVWKENPLIQTGCITTLVTIQCQ